MNWEQIKTGLLKTQEIIAKEMNCKFVSTEKNDGKYFSKVISYFKNEGEGRFQGEEVSVSYSQKKGWKFPYSAYLYINKGSFLARPLRVEFGNYGDGTWHYSNLDVGNGVEGLRFLIHVFDIMREQGIELPTFSDVTNELRLDTEGGDDGR